MIGKDTLKTYDLETIIDYFEMVLTSKLNGQRKQTIEQYNKLSLTQKVGFREHVISDYSGKEYKNFIEYIGN